MSLAFDENGRPFIILREQEKKKRVKGLEAHKVSQPAPPIQLISINLCAQKANVSHSCLAQSPEIESECLTF